MSNLTVRMDILDLVIRCLEEHEKELDNLVDRLEKAVSVAERQAMR